MASIARDAKTSLEESQMAGALDRLVKVMGTSTSRALKASTCCKRPLLIAKEKPCRCNTQNAWRKCASSSFQKSRSVWRIMMDQADAIEGLMGAREACLGLEIPGISQCPEDVLYHNEMVGCVWEVRVGLYHLEEAVGLGGEKFSLMDVLSKAAGFTEDLEKCQSSKVRGSAVAMDWGALKVVDAEALVSIVKCGMKIMIDVCKSWENLKLQMKIRCNFAVKTTLEQIRELGDYDSTPANLWWQMAENDSIEALILAGKKTVQKYTLEFLNSLISDVDKARTRGNMFWIP